MRFHAMRSRVLGLTMTLAAFAAVWLIVRMLAALLANALMPA
jgi:hypothetical protein